MKFNCKDDLVTLLQQYGYSLVLLPRENIAPLQIFTRNSKGLWARLKDTFATPGLDDSHALLNELFITDSQPLPVATPGDVVNQVKGKRSSSMSIEAATELMLHFMNLPDAGKDPANLLKIEAALKTAKEVNFSFGDDAQEVSVSQIQLDAYLNDAAIRAEVGPTYRELIEGGQLYIVTSVLRASTFTMKGSNERHGSTSIDIPKIKEVLSGKMKGNVDVFEQSGMIYKGEKLLVFGFKAVRLLAKQLDGKWVYRIKAQDGLAVKGDEDFLVETLLPSEGNFLELE